MTFELVGIREKRFATEVEAGNYCVSSCPLVFAGGVNVAGVAKIKSIRA
jgi:hypothetical protein